MNVRQPFDADHFTYRVIRDAMNEATGAYWRRRAAAFRPCGPPPSAGGSPGAERERARFARRSMIADNCENHATLCDESLTEIEQSLILDEIDRCTVVHRYMRHADHAATLFDLRALWRDAHQAGRLDVQLARHLDRRAKRIRDGAAADHREALAISRAMPQHLRAGAA